jgi:hypothetical protein
MLGSVVIVKINYYKYPGFEIQALALDRHTNVAGLRIVLAKQEESADTLMIAKYPSLSKVSCCQFELQGYYGVFCIQRFDMISG